jgi:hypothetical protein
MHPEHLGALARQRRQERTPYVQLRTPPPAVRAPRPDGPGMLRRARRQLGSVLLDVGVHLMLAT